MATTDGNNTLFLDASNPGTVGLGLGNDRYVLSNTSLAANQSLTISDADGANTLQLVGGLTITSSLVSNNAIQLTLSNGAKVTVLGASTFTFLTGGDAFSGTGGVSQTFSQFVTVALGATVPAANAAAVPVGPVTLVSGGTTTPGTGQPFTLTQGVDSTVGNDSDNIINALADNGVPTFQAADVVNGAGGIDTINVLVTAATVGLTNITNTEVFNFTATGAAPTTVNMADVVGETAVSSVNSTAGLVVNNIVGPAVTLGLNGVTTAAANGVTFNFAPNSLAGTADSVTLNTAATGAAAARVDVALNEVAVTGAVETLIINAASSSSFLTGLHNINGAGTNLLRTITVTGTGNVDHLADPFASTLLTTVNATAATGNVALAVSGAANVNATFGGGQTTFGMVGNILTGLDTVTGGAGSNDEFQVDTVIGTTNGISNAVRVTGFEVLGLTGNGLTQDMDNFSVSRVHTTITGTNAAITNALNNTVISVDGDGAAAAGGQGALGVTLKTDTQADTLTLNLGGTRGGADLTNITADTAKYETVIINSVGPIANAITGFAAAVQNVNIAGSIGFTMASSANVTGVIEAGNLTAGLTITAINQANQTVNATGVADSLTVNSAATNMIVNAQAGNDTIAITATGNGLAINGGAGSDTITAAAGITTTMVIDGGAGVDIIDVADATQANIESTALTAADADRIVNFTTTVDDYIYKGAVVNGTNSTIILGNVATSAGAATVSADLSAALAASASATVYIVTQNLIGDASDALQAGTASLTTATAANFQARADVFETALSQLLGTVTNLDAVLNSTDRVLMAFDNGNSTVIVRISNTDTTIANTLTASEIEVVGVLTGTAALAAADFIA